MMPGIIAGLLGPQAGGIPCLRRFVVAGVAFVDLDIQVIYSATIWMRASSHLDCRRAVITAPTDEFA